MMEHGATLKAMWRTVGSTHQGNRVCHLEQRPLAGLDTLVVEDEFLIAQLLCDDLGLMGATIIGPFSRIAPAMERIASGESLQAAILDINIAGEEVYPLADELVKLGVKVVFLTGYTRVKLPARFASYPVFSKNAPIEELVTALT